MSSTGRHNQREDRCRSVSKTQFIEQQAGITITLIMVGTIDLYCDSHTAGGVSDAPSI